jgi:hypothetical protein
MSLRGRRRLHLEWNSDRNLFGAFFETLRISDAGFPKVCVFGSSNHPEIEH